MWRHILIITRLFNFLSFHCFFVASSNMFFTFFRFISMFATSLTTVLGGAFASNELFTAPTTDF